jgi:hypothetical protein
MKFSNNYNAREVCFLIETLAIFSYQKNCPVLLPLLLPPPKTTPQKTARRTYLQLTIFIE